MVAQLALGEAFGGEPVDDAEGVAELVVEERALHAARQRRGDVGGNPPREFGVVRPLGRIALDQQFIDQLPELVAEVAKGLGSANLTVYNGAEGVNEIMTGVITQGAGLLRSLQDQLQVGPAAEQSQNGSAQ